MAYTRDCDGRRVKDAASDRVLVASFPGGKFVSEVENGVLNVYLTGSGDDDDSNVTDTVARGPMTPARLQKRIVELRKTIGR